MTTRFLLIGKKSIDEIILVGIPNLDLGATATNSHFVRIADVYDFSHEDQPWVTFIV